MNTTLHWSPYVGNAWFWLLALAALGVALVAWRFRARDFYWRAALFALIAFLLLNPIVLNEVRETLPDKVVIVVDESASQSIGGRDKVAEKALSHIEARLKEQGGPEPVVIRAAGRRDSRQGESTRLFADLRDNMMRVPLQQVSGTIFITDGQVHDVPDELAALARFAPFHTLLTGKKDEFDRKVTVVSAPKYGLLNDNVRISVRVDEYGARAAAPLTLQVMQDGQVQSEAILAAGEEREFTFKLSHPGQNVFEFRTPVAENELTPANNTAPVIINGVRDRLKVLLVSGMPHMGERAWRNLLKSDPGIDLVHFTILRSPNAVDRTPTRELSLIVFPVEELFATKIDDFDLIIFDKYQQYNLLMPYYFTNIRNYIREGGAFLLAMGSDKAEESIFETALADTLPVNPSRGEVFRNPYRAALSDAGKTHPVTADLGGARNWGEWFTQVEVDQKSGQTLMTGHDGAPLLIIDKVEKGRVATLMSDNIWFWSKGGKSAGPYTELLRNLSHWLMKEPELEDDYIKAEAQGTVITVSKRDIGPEKKTVVMTTPSGKESELTLDTREGGWIVARHEAEESGIYSFASGQKKAFVVVGTAMNEEFADVHTTPDLLQPVVAATGGATIWFDSAPDLDIRYLSAQSRSFGGADWLGLRQNEAYQVSSVESQGLVNNWLFLIVILASLVWVWRREGGRS